MCVTRGFYGLCWLHVGFVGIDVGVSFLGTWRLVPLSMLLPSSMGSNATKSCLLVIWLLVKPHFISEIAAQSSLSVPGVP
jgi:hypothetical protein